MNLPFVPAVFYKVLAVTLTVVLIGLVVALVVEDELAGRDIAGALISAPIFAYMVHLWITMGKDW